MNQVTLAIRNERTFVYLLEEKNLHQLFFVGQILAIVAKIVFDINPLDMALHDFTILRGFIVIYFTGVLLLVAGWHLKQVKLSNTGSYIPIFLLIPGIVYGIIDLLALIDDPSYWLEGFFYLGTYASYMIISGISDKKLQPFLVSLSFVLLFYFLYGLTYQFANPNPEDPYPALKIILKSQQTQNRSSGNINGLIWLVALTHGISVFIRSKLRQD